MRWVLVDALAGLRRVRGALLPAVLAAGAAGGLAPAASASSRWTAASEYPLPMGAVAASARVAFDADDVATVAYVDSANVLHVGLVAPGRAFAQEFSTPVQGAGQPSLAEAPDGAAVAEWVDPGGAALAAYRPARAIAWQDPVIVASAGGTLTTTISSDGDGAAAVSAAGGGITIRPLPAGAVEAPASPAGAPAPSDLALGEDASGDLTAAWVSGTQLIAQTYGPAGAGPAQVASDVSGGPVSLAVAPDGSAVIAYPGAGGAEALVRGGPGAAWSGPIPVAAGATALAAAISPDAEPYAIVPANVAYVLFARAGCAGLARGSIGGAFAESPCLPAGAGMPAAGGLEASGLNAYAAWSGASGLFAADWPAAAPAPVPARAVPLASAGGLTQVLGDGTGSAAALWSDGGGLEDSAFDVTSPVLLDEAVPGRGAVDQSLTLSVTFADLWSVLRHPPVWSFGRGSKPVEGAQVSHTFGRAGTYRVTVTATDMAGNATIERFRIVVGAAQRGR